jgi:hypothetical protein
LARGNNNPNKLLGNPAYVLNIHGKKADWNPSGDFSNPDRHTMFVPQGTSEVAAEVKLWISQALKGSSDPFIVLDGNAFDDGELRLQIADGYYAVYVVALGKPMDPEIYGANIKGVVTDSVGTPLQFLGAVDGKSLKPHGKQPVWDEYTNLFYITEDQIAEYLVFMGIDPVRAAELASQIMDFFADYQVQVGVDEFDNPIYGIWIFDFYEFLANYLEFLLTPEENEVLGEIQSGQYYWDLKNKGLRHIQIRFYKVGNRDWQYLLE